MISAQQIDQPTEHVRERARKCKVKTLTPWSFAVTPPEKGKLVRLVHFDYDQETGVVRIECFARETGEVCEANNFSRPCAHVFAASTRLLANAKRAHKIEAEETEKRNRQIQDYAQKVVNETEQPDLEGINK